MVCVPLPEGAGTDDRSIRVGDILPIDPTDDA
jgi:hypothetical protein